ncbi:MAG: Terminase-like domain protein [Leptospira sp.]|nr:Terminase-like domain protein [Leptospira sp.]
MQLDREILEAFSEEGTKAFSKIQKNDRTLYGKKNGAKDLLAYARYIDPQFDTPKHIKLIAETLTKVEQGKIKRLIINMPPQHGKTQLTSKIFPTWCLGRNPTLRFTLASYSEALAKEATLWQRNTVMTAEYKNVFNRVQLMRDSSEADNWKVALGGSVRATGVAGPAVGMPSDYFIIDDP